MAEPEVITKLREITNIDPKLHLFCDDAERKQHAINCLQIIGYDGPDALPWQSKLMQKLDSQLGRCDKCIVEYYKAQRKFVEDLRNDFDDEDVENFVRLLDERDTARIQRGLDNVKRTLLALPREQRRQNAVRASDLYAMFEALTCESFLTNAELLSAHFDEPFVLLQTNKALKVMHWVPALLRFLFDERPERSRWARENWLKLEKRLTEEEFDFAIRNALADQLNTALINFPTSESVYKLWSGLHVVINRLDGDLITHSLRAMEQDVYRLALDHLQVDSPGFAPLLKTIRALLTKGPKDFWDAMGAIAPATVIEQIFSSPQYDQSMLQTKQAGGKNILVDLLAWVEPFIISLQTSHKPQACRSLVQQLMSRLQGSKIPPHVRAECYRTGLEVIYRTLEEFCQESFNFHGVGRTVALDILNLTSEHMSQIISTLKASQDEAEQNEVLSACFKAIRYSLKLECNIVRTDRVKIHYDESFHPDFQPFRPKIWPAIERNFLRGNCALARICIEEISELTGLEGLESKKESELPHPKERKQFSSVLHDFCGVLSNILEKINDFDPKYLNFLSAEREAGSHLFKLLFSADPSISSAGLTLIKTVSGASFRKEALSHVLQMSFDQTLRTVLWAISRITMAKTFSACPRMLKLITDILDLLCDSQGGILRSQALPPTSLKLVRDCWESVWQALHMIYDNTKAWEFHIRVPILSDFCRDVMQFSEHLFDQFSVFEAALGSILNEPPGEDDNPLSEDNRGRATDLLTFPLETLKGVFIYLKLRDEYLLSKCVRLTRKLLLQLTSRKKILPLALSENFEKLTSPFSKVASNLTGQQKAEIRRALEENEGHLFPDELEEQSGTSTPDVEFQKATVMKPSTKQAIIDLDSWSSRAREREQSDKNSTAVNDSTEQFRAQQAQKTLASFQKSAAKITLTTGMTKPLPKQLANNRELSRASQQAKQADQNAFLTKRKESQLEKKRQDAEAAAKAKKHLLPNSIAGITAGEGSVLGNIGSIGREHVKKSSEIMVSSGSESESEDEADKAIFGPAYKQKPSAAVSDYNASRRQQIKVQQPVKKVKQVRNQKDLRARVAPDLSPIHQAILSWNFFHEDDFPPGSNRTDYSMVSQTFRTAQDHRKTFEPLLLLEAWQSFRQAQEEASGKAFSITIVNRMTIDKLIEISSTVDAAQFSEKTLFEGDIMLLSKASAPSQAPDQPNCLARIFKLNKKQNSVEVTFKVAQTNQLIDHLVPKAELRGEKINSLIPLEREYGALLGLTYYDLCDEIIKAYPSPLLTYNDSVLDKLIRCYGLNRAQAKAVQSAMDNDAFTLIQGPPGSGKTKTIVAIVGALLTGALTEPTAVSISVPNQPNGAGNSQKSAVAKKLLVCAPSNAAVDELVMRFMQGIKTSTGEFRKPSVIRLGKSESINPKVKDVTLDELVEKKMNIAVPAENSKEGDDVHKVMLEHKSTCDKLNELRAILDKQNGESKKTSAEQYHQLEVLRRRKDQLSNRIDQLRDSGNTFARNAEIRKNHVRQEIIDGAHVLCATLSGSGHDMLRNLQLDFDTVIIDEAAQSIELSALIPLKYGCSKCIMVGDPKQLPPTVLSKAAARFQYEQSLFVRMQANSPDNVHLLDTQYRMHPAISAFPSRAFYESRLLDGPNMASIRQKPWHADQLLGPYRFFDVQGMHQSAPKGHSLVNPAEIDIALKLFRRLTTCAKDYSFKGKIGIITPYKSQLHMLKDRFKHEHGNEITNMVEFNTTDAFQGRESEVIIFSCVRASNTGIGFLSDIRRMNVGITRAKSSLWVLGNASSLMQGEYWSKLIENSKERNLYTSDTLRAIAQPPRRVSVRLEPEEVEQPQVDFPDIVMTDAPPLETDPQPKSTEPNGVSESMKEGNPGSRKRSPPSPTEPSHSTKLQRSEGFEGDKKKSRHNSPSSRQSPLPASDLELKEATNGAQQPSRIRLPEETGPSAVRPSDSAPKPPANRGVRPPAAIKKRGDESAFIIPKRRPR